MEAMFNMEDDDVSTQCTQPIVDPRRMGMNNSGLSAEDVADVICILHPTTPAAFRLVNETARFRPQHVLQNEDLPKYETPRPPKDELETFILPGMDGLQAMDLAFRFSSRAISPHLGFILGRNPEMCDIAITLDSNKRVSNVHFAVFFNDTGVLMLRDMSTNGTLVDDVLLKGKASNHPTSRMLLHGSTIQVLSPDKNEVLKFIVRYPSRDGFIEEYNARFQDHMSRRAEAIARWRREKGIDEPDSHLDHASMKAPMTGNKFGMHWNGGETYNVVNQIGKGAFATVYQLATKRDGHLYAAKELEKRKFMKNGILDQKLDNEMRIMQSIDHPSIVQYHDYQDVANHLYIIMEYVPHGDLQHWLTSHGPLPEFLAKQMSAQVLDALDYLHNKNITHRDIKPDNILLTSVHPDNFTIKLSDFGLSKAVHNNDTFLKTFCGTLLYCAPEVFPHYDAHAAGHKTKRPRVPEIRGPKKSRSYSHAVDIWSFGAVLWFSLCLDPPFAGVADATGRGMFDKIMTTPLDARGLEKYKTSKAAVDLLVQMLNTDPAVRPTAEECLDHVWFEGNRPIPRRSTILGAIEEEGSTDAVAGAVEPGVASLSLDEPSLEGQQVQAEELSFTSSDMNFFDPRKSKRFKTNDMDDREDGDLVDSSPDVEGCIPIMQEPTEEREALIPKPPKLFGEISESDLQGPALERQTDEAAGVHVYSADSPSAQLFSQGSQQDAQFTSKSSQSNERSRDMDLDSSFFQLSQEVEATRREEAGDGPLLPTTPPAPVDEITQVKSQGPVEETPKPLQTREFSRQISLPIPASFYFEPADPSTHNLEYATKVSGHNFLHEPEYWPTDIPSLATTMTSGKLSDSKNRSSASNCDQSSGDRSDSALSHHASDMSNRAMSPIPAARPRFGRLISTPESFASICIDLNTRVTSWGRSSQNTHRYDPPDDTRVAKVSMIIFMHGTGIENIPEGEEDLDRLPGSYCGILTHGSTGLRINGVPLKKAAAGQQTYGKLHSGDVVQVWPRSADQPGLAFVVELYCGEGKRRRERGEPRFVLEHETRAASSSRASKSWRGKKEDVTATVSASASVASAAAVPSTCS